MSGQYKLKYDIKKRHLEVGRRAEMVVMEVRINYFISD